MQLQRSHTLRRAREFAYVRTHGKSHVGRHLVLSVAPVQSSPGAESCLSRFGIITTKRLGCAVVRNKLRRRVRELLRTHGDPLRNGLYVVLILRQSAAQASFASLEKDFLYLLKRYFRQQDTADSPC